MSEIVIPNLIFIIIITILIITLQMLVPDRNHWRFGFRVSTLSDDTPPQLLITRIMRMRRTILTLGRGEGETL